HLIGPSMEQPQYNMLWREKLEKEFLLLFRDFGMGTTIWSPLASGLLSGKYNTQNKEQTRFNMESLSWLKDRLLVDKNLQIVSELKVLADELGISLPRLAIAWCLKNPNVSTVILGASKRAQLEENLKAGEAVGLLSEELLEKIDQITGTKPFTVVV